MAQKKSPEQTGEPTPANELVFEDAAERLETIVREMEDGRLALEQLIAHYEEGMKLVNFCSQSLSAAEKRIEVIQQNAQGELSTAPAQDLEEASTKAAETTGSASATRSTKNTSRKDQSAATQRKTTPAAEDDDSQTTDDELSLF